MAHWYDGRAVLGQLLEESRYKSVAGAVAALTLFSHPDTVAQTGHCPVFRIVRNPHVRGKRLPGPDGRDVQADDNHAPTQVFLWANGLSASKYRDVQFNHLYGGARDGAGMAGYTALPNLCVTPAFLAKLTDTDAAVCALLRYRAFALYGYCPDGVPTPQRPAGYAALDWRPPHDAVSDVEQRFRLAMATKPRDRTVIAARELGWHFSDFAPELSFRTPDGVL
jgi:hypothetical protein